MYNSIKKTIKWIIPEKLLFKNELIFRFFYGLFYLGKKHQCNICNKKLRRFIELKNNDLLCPCCGSLSRNRRLWKLLNDNANIKGNVLQFSPSRSIFRKLKKEKNIEYYATDFENEFLADHKFDITKIDQPNDKFDTIICFHILEHVIDDQKAIGELYRVLKPNGTIYIQTPFKEGSIYEDYSIKSPEEREKHFGQKDHVRIYSVDGLVKRLENSELKVFVETFERKNTDEYLGFISPETVFKVTK